MRMPPVPFRTVLITGCSSGIGAAAAVALRDAGWRVFASARRDDDLERLRADGFTPVRLDTADAASVAAAARAVLDLTGGEIGALVNNAGVGHPGAVEDLTRANLCRQFEVNVFGMHQLTAALIPAFRAAGAGRIVNISSVLGRVTLPMLGAYCASKHAMESLSDAMRIELRRDGIAVSLIEPGPIESSFRRTAAQIVSSTMSAEQARYHADYMREAERRRSGLSRPDPFTLPPTAVAVKIRHALESRRPRRRYCVTLPAYLGAALARFAPTALTDLLFATRVPKREE